MGIFFYLGLFCFTVFFSVSAFCVPSISGISGNISSGSSVTINGSGFGANGPNIIVFDDFEGGINGNSINLGAGSATVGTWEYYSGTGPEPYYTNTLAHSGNLSFQADMSVHWLNYVGKSFPGTTKVYLSYWFNIPSGTNWPGEAGAQLNHKLIWLLGSSTTDDDYWLPVKLDGSTWNVAGNGTTGIFPTEWPSVNYTKGEWKRLSFWVNGGYSNDGQMHMFGLRNTGTVQLINNNNDTILSSGGQFQNIHINGYGDTSPNSIPTFDDVYVATGDSARARVEIGDQSTYLSSGKLAISTVDSWNDTQITFTVRQGAFTNGESAYLYVFDGDNAVNSTGYPVTIGSGGTATQLSAPQNLHFIFP